MSHEQIEKRFRWQNVAGILFGFVAVCAAYYYVSTSIHTGPRISPQEKTTALMQVLSVVFSAYEKDNGALPPSLENFQLVKTFSGNNPRQTAYFLPHSYELSIGKEYVDGWGTPLRFSNVAGNKVLITSAGPDKIFGTPDDITNQ